MCLDAIDKNIGNGTAWKRSNAATVGQSKEQQLRYVPSTHLYLCEIITRCSTLELTPLPSDVCLKIAIPEVLTILPSINSRAVTRRDTGNIGKPSLRL